MKNLLTSAIVLTAALPLFAQDAPPPPLTTEPPLVVEPEADPETQKKIDLALEKLASDDWDARAEGEKELEAIGKPAVAALKKAMADATDPEVKVRAKRVLEKLGALEVKTELDETQMEDLVNLLKAQDGVSWYPSNPKPYFYLYQLQEKREYAEALKDPKFAPKLAAKLDDPSGNLKRNIAYLLADMGNQEVAEDLRALLKDEESLTRAIALYSLGQIGNAKVAGDVVKALDDEDVLVRQSAAIALENLPTADAIPRLLAALKDKDARIRFHAYYSLRSLTGAVVKFNAWWDEKAREASVKEFEGWWGSHKDGFVPKAPKKPEKETPGK